MTKILLALLLLSPVLFAETKAKRQVSQTLGDSTLIRYDYKPGEITQLTEQAIKKMEQDIDAIIRVPEKEKSFENTIAALDRASIEFDDTTSKLGFMAHVSTDEAMRQESTNSEKMASEYSIKLFTRRDLYNAVAKADRNAMQEKLDPVQKRLVEQTMRGFKRSGLFLDDAKLDEVKKLKTELSGLTVEFSNNIGEDKSTLEFSAAELDGAPASFLERLKKLPNGKYLVTTKSTDYVTIMENVHSSETRRKMLTAYENRAAQNIEILKKVLVLRQQIAAKLGYKSWADYATEERMAKNAKTANDFLQGLKAKLAKRNKEDLEVMLKYKKTIDPKATHLDPWDARYLENQIKKKYFTLDNEVIRQYFPADATVEKMFKIYSTLFGVKFVEVKNAPVWSENVKLYEIRNSKDNSFVANFYADFYPREGKYSHAAAFGLVTGGLVNGKYITPVASIVSNFEPPANGKPSLLTHDEVETLFHEFGHIMHQTLTRSRYGSLAGTRVARDFVEAPSQMLENWVWDPTILKNLSGHYKNPNQKLPEEIIKKLLESKDFNKGYFYSRQLLFGIFDMTLHMSTTPIDDPTALYKKLYKEIAHVEPLAQTNFPASFGHLMGYDAGYYGYLWSKVFSDDMFTLFEKEGLLNSELGLRYRKNILEQGDSYEANKLLTDFLKRKPNNKAFLKNILGNSCADTLSKIGQ